MQTGALFQPLDLGPIRLPNRVMMAPMGTCLDRDGHITDASIAYYRRRAAGGVGAITVEGCLVSADSKGPEPRISGPEYTPGLARLVEELRSYEVAVGVQLMHPGRQVTSGPSVAPSPVPLNSRAPVPHELTRDEIADIVADFGAAAKRAMEAGFDYVEVHGAHGYLPSNFLSARDNRRVDSYGGTLSNRARFSLEIAEAILEMTGGMPLIWRLNGDDAIAGGFAIDDAVEVAGWLEQCGVTALSVSAGTWHSLDVTLAPMYVKRGHMRDLASAVKKAVDVPVAMVGRLDEPPLAAEVVDGGEADIVIIGRGLIADPDWAAKVRDLDRGRIRPCIACNACVDRVGRGLPLRCAVNAEAGREAERRPEPPSRPRRVMVVGAGPAGMEAAATASARGHSVALWEKDPRLGGKLEAASRAPSKREVLRFRDYLVGRLVDLGVDVHCGVPVGPDLVADEDPDLVLIATGADLLRPPITGADLAFVKDAQDFLGPGSEAAEGRSVVVVGGSATGCEAAESLLAAGAAVTMLEMGDVIGVGIEAITRRNLLRTLKREGADIRTGAKVIAFEAPRAVRYEDRGGEVHMVYCDLVALATGWRPRGQDLAERLKGREVKVIGDAIEPSDFISAIGAGADAGSTA